MSGKGKDEVKTGAIDRIKTGGEVDAIVLSLVQNAFDPEEQVRVTIAESLSQLGRHQPHLVLTSLMNFVTTAKIEHGHRVVCLKIIGKVMEHSRDAISQPVAETLGKFSATEMVMSQEVRADWQGPASAILAALAVPFPNIVIDQLLAHFPPGDVPHYYIVKTLADVAAAAGVAFTLRLQEVLSRVIPVLGGIKKEPMRWAFATALGRFCEAIAHFHANAPDDSKLQLSQDAFQTDFSAAFDVVFTKWLLSNEAKVRFAVVEALGNMMWRISPKDFEANLQRMVPVFLQLYKKEKPEDHLPISQGFCALLDAAVFVRSPALEMILSQILQGLHPLVCKTPDFKQPQTLKIHNEVLRCFEVLARGQLDHVLTFCINRFPTGNPPAAKVGSLLVLRHLVNSLDEELEEKKDFILSSVQSLVDDPDLTIRKSMLQLIVSMANKNYLSLNGGQVLLRFVVKQCSIPDDVCDDKRHKDKGKAEAALSYAQLRSAATHILRVMTNKVTSTHPVLWPFLLELISTKEFGPGIVVILQCIHELVTTKREQGEDVKIDFAVNVNVPSPQTILARLMILANTPHKRKGLGSAVVDCMGSLAFIIHDSVGKYWSEAVPALKEHLEAHTEEELNLQKWQDSLLRMFRETINAVGVGPWLRDLAQSLTEQYPLYKGDAVLRRVMHRYMGALMAVETSKDLISSKIDLILEEVDHSNDLERQGCAQGLGMAAGAHLDTVLAKITAELKKMGEKKKGGFFSFGDSNPSKEQEPRKSTYILCYGYVTAYADTKLVVSRVDAHILANMLPVMKEAVTLQLRENVIKAVDLIGKALDPERLGEDSKFVLKPRDDLVLGILAYIRQPVAENNKAPPKPSFAFQQLRVLGLNAVATMAQLRPPLSEDMRKKILDVVLPFYSLVVEGAVTAPAVTSPVVGPMPTAAAPVPSPTASSEPAEDEKTPAGDADSLLSPRPASGSLTAAVGGLDANIIALTIANLNSLLEALIQVDLSTASLVALLQRLEYYVVSKKPLERERACESYLVILKKFVTAFIPEIKNNNRKYESELPHLGHFLATLLPRCTDPSLTIRQTSVENIQMLLYVDQVFHNPANHQPSQDIKLFNEIRKRMEVQALSGRLAVAADLASVLVKVVAPSEFPSLVQSLMSGLNDPEPEASLGTAAVVEVLVSRRGAEVLAFLAPLLSGLLKMSALIPADVMTAVLRSVRVVTRHHFAATLDILFEQTMPLSKEVKSFFVSLADEDQGLAIDTLKKLISVINETPLLEDKPTPKVMVATSALGEVLTVPSVQELARAPEFYSPLICTLFMRLGTAHGVDHAASSRDACKSLQALFEATNCSALNASLTANKTWSKFAEDKEYDDGMTAVTKAWCGAVTEEKKRESVITYLAEFLSQRNPAGQRGAATTVLAEMVNHCGGSSALLREMVKLLLPKVVDMKDMIRKQALRGLGNLEPVWDDEVATLASSVLSALTSASEDKMAFVAAEAVASLTRVVRVVTEDTMAPLLINICFRMRPAFDRKENEIRKAAFNLFAELCRFGTKNSNAANFMEQMHANMTTFVVHVNDEEPDVRQACLQCFVRVAAITHEDMHKVLLSATTDSHMFESFVAELAPVLVSLFPARLSSYMDAAVDYYKSKWNCIRGNAATFCAHVLAAASSETRQRLNINSLCTTLTKLLKEDSAEVRNKAAKGLSLLYDL